MLASALQMVAAFNLVCAGTLRTGPIGLALPESGGTPFEITYRIDLDGGRWCSDECDTIEPVALVLDGQIVLRELYTPAGSSVIMISPATRRFTDTTIAGDTATLRSGVCVAGAFTGFPVRVA
jgi:hypothetical protein